jgi:hypothetical protein
VPLLRIGEPYSDPTALVMLQAGCWLAVQLWWCRLTATHSDMDLKQNMSIMLFECLPLHPALVRLVHIQPPV